MKRLLAFVAFSGLLFVQVDAGAGHANKPKAHWGRKGVKVVDSLTSAWDAKLATAIESWNSGTKKVKLRAEDGSDAPDVRAACPYVKKKVRACNGFYGDRWGPNVAGLAQYFYALRSRHITKARVWINETYAGGVEQAVMTHELGHILGLNHRPPGDLTSCMTAVVTPGQVNPDAHDYKKVNKLHRHLPHGKRAQATAADTGGARDDHLHERRGRDVRTRRVGNEIEVTWIERAR